MRGSRIEQWFPWLIVASGVLAYANSFGCPFLFDDSLLIVTNRRITSLWPPWHAITAPTRFLADLSFALNYAVGGLVPADFRMTNLAIHLVAGLLLFGVVRRTLLLPRLALVFGAAATPLAFAIALLWVVHPLQTESVTYIVQRVESLMGCFYLLALYGAVRAAATPHPWRWRALACAACYLGMGTKEIMVTAPFLILVHDGLFVAPSWRTAFRERWRFHLILLLSVGFFVLLLRLHASRAAEEGGLFYGGIPRGAYLLTQFQAIAHYVKLALVPWPLCLDYQWPLVRQFASVAPIAVVLAPVGILTLWGVWKRWPIAFLPFAFFAILAPTSSVVPLPDAVFEHRMYLPLAAVIGLVVIGGYAAIRRVLGDGPAPAAWRGVGAVALLLAAGACIAMTRQRNLDYRSEEAMWRDVMAKRPNNWRACNSLTTVLVREGRAAEAAVLSRQLLARLPNFSKMSFTQVAEQWSQDRSVPCAEYATAHNNLGAALLLQGHAQEAKAHFTEALRVVPAATWARRNLAQVLFDEGNVADAAFQWRTVLHREPRNIEVYRALGKAYAALGNYAEAINACRVGLGVAPSDHPLQMELAWLLAACPDDALRNGGAAIKIARALQDGGNAATPEVLDVLAAAHAEAGQFDEAVVAAEQAAGVLARGGPGRTDSNAVQAVRARLDLYRAGKPFRIAAGSRDLP